MTSSVNKAKALAEIGTSGAVAPMVTTVSAIAAAARAAVTPIFTHPKVEICPVGSLRLTGSPRQ
ncbi:hypothetical protein D3C87_1765140 [compost metagenome]